LASLREPKNPAYREAGQCKTEILADIGKK
jgi:hypothetical protein